MPRTSRSVAQRLAAQGKSRKRRQRPMDAPTSTSPVADQVVEEAAAPSEAGSPEAVTPTVPRPAAATPASPARTTRVPARSSGTPRTAATVSARLASATARYGSRAAPTRRRYKEYGAEYAYVWSDLKRICIVAVTLIALLVVLSYFIQ